MSDKSYDQNDGASGSANPDVSRGNASGTQEQTGSEVFITKKDFEALQRQLQSQTDKAINNSVDARLRQMKSELEKTLAATRAAGVEIPPEKEAILRQQMIDKALFADEAPASAKGQAQQSDALAWVTEAADDIMEEYGVHIPVRELQAISGDTPASYLKQVRELAKRKASGRNDTTTPTTPPDSRTFFGSNLGGVPTPQTQDTLRDAYLQEVNAYKASHPRATTEQLFDIREKYLSKGWNGISK